MATGRSFPCQENPQAETALVLFFALTFGWSWACWLGAAWLKHRTALPAAALDVLGGFGPSGTKAMPVRFAKQIQGPGSNQIDDHKKIVNNMSASRFFDNGFSLISLSEIAYFFQKLPLCTADEPSGGLGSSLEAVLMD
jgi:hypothetical protein